MLKGFQHRGRSLYLFFSNVVVDLIDSRRNSLVLKLDFTLA